MLDESSRLLSWQTKATQPSSYGCFLIDIFIIVYRCLPGDSLTELFQIWYTEQVQWGLGACSRVSLCAEIQSQNVYCTHNYMYGWVFSVTWTCCYSAEIPWLIFLMFDTTIRCQGIDAYNVEIGPVPIHVNLILTYFYQCIDAWIDSFQIGYSDQVQLWLGARKIDFGSLPKCGNYGSLLSNFDLISLRFYINICN